MLGRGSSCRLLMRRRLLHGSDLGVGRAGGRASPLNTESRQHRKEERVQVPPYDLPVNRMPMSDMVEALPSQGCLAMKESHDEYTVPPMRGSAGGRPT